jgi:hypothetical protein
MSEKRKYRTFTPEQKLEIVLAGLRGDRSVRDVCREHGIAETLYYQWRDRLLEAARLRWRRLGIAAVIRPSRSCARRRSASRSWNGPVAVRPTKQRSRGTRLG